MTNGAKEWERPGKKAGRWKRYSNERAKRQNGVPARAHGLQVNKEHNEVPMIVAGFIPATNRYVLETQNEKGKATISINVTWENLEFKNAHGNDTERECYYEDLHGSKKKFIHQIAPGARSTTKRTPASKEKTDAEDDGEDDAHTIEESEVSNKISRM